MAAEGDSVAVLVVGLEAVVVVIAAEAIELAAGKSVSVLAPH